MTLHEIEKIVTGFFNYEAQIKGNQYFPNLPKAVKVNHTRNDIVSYDNISSDNANTSNMINHFHKLFPKCQLIIHTNNHNSALNNEQIKNIPVMFVNQNQRFLSFSIPLPPFQPPSTALQQPFKPHST